MEEDEVLQTKIVSPKEVARRWKEWLPAIESEVQSLVEEKEALRMLTKEEVHQLQIEAERTGLTMESVLVEDGLHTQARTRRRQAKGPMGRMRQL